MTSIIMLPFPPPMAGFDLFKEAPLKTVYVVSEEAKKLYETTRPWNEYEIVVLPTGIDDLEVEKGAPNITGYYDLNGRQLAGKQRGPMIIRYADGTRRKVLVK